MITVSKEDVRPTLNASPQPTREHGILVVDDDEDMRDALDLWLRHQGYGVWTATTGAEAIDLYKHYRDVISVVLMKVNLPVMDGPQTLVELRQLNPQVCCCFMSDSLSSHNDAALHDLGAETVLRKPFTLMDVDKLLWKLAAPIQRQTSMQDDLWRDDGGQG